MIHKHVTHNTANAKFRDFADVVLDFPCEVVPRSFGECSSTITYSFRVIDPNDFRIAA